MSLRVRVPASSANLGPAFDCLGLALNLYNEIEISLEGAAWQIEIEGEGAASLPRSEKNRIARAFAHAYAKAGQSLPPGLRLTARNHIPLSSGLGSSSAAAVAGLLAANACLGQPFSAEDLLQLAADLEGHADNAAAALYGGLVLVYAQGGRWQVQPLAHHPLPAVAVLPDLHLSTHAARAALPPQVTLSAAVANIGHSLLLAEAWRQGDLALLAHAMQDQLHQPARLPLLPGAAAAIAAAQAIGGAAALSGAGPSVIAFVESGNEDRAAQVMQAAFAEHKLSTRVFQLQTTQAGALVL